VNGTRKQTKQKIQINKVNLFVSSVLCVFWYHSPNVLDTLHICNISWLRVKLCSKCSPMLVSPIMFNLLAKESCCFSLLYIFAHLQTIRLVIQTNTLCVKIVYNFHTQFIKTPTFFDVLYMLNLCKTSQKMTQKNSKHVRVWRDCR
jgi:hypothetical protein